MSKQWLTFPIPLKDTSILKQISIKIIHQSVYPCKSNQLIVFHFAAQINIFACSVLWHHQWTAGWSVYDGPCRVSTQLQSEEDLRLQKSLSSTEISSYQFKEYLVLRTNQQRLGESSSSQSFYSWFKGPTLRIVRTMCSRVYATSWLLLFTIY